MGVGRTIGHAEHELADGLDAGGDEDVTLAGLDGMSGHADRLQRGGAVAVDRDTRDMAHAGEFGHDAGDVVALHAGGLGGAEDDVLDEAAIEGRDLVERGADDGGGEIVGTDLGE